MLKINSSAKNFILKSFLALSLVFSPILAQAETITVGTEARVTVPKDAKRIVALNYETLDFLDKFGMGDRVVGMLDGTAPDHLMKYQNNSKIAKLGSMKEIDMKALAAAKPDIIFASGRTAGQFMEFSKIAPTVVASASSQDGFMNGYRKNAMMHATIFGKEKETRAILDGYQKRIDALAKKTAGKTVLCITTTGGKVIVGNSNAKNIATTDLGLKNVGHNLSREESQKADPFKLITDAKADYIFVLDRGTAIGEKNPKASELLEKNTAFKNTTAFKNKRVIYYEPVRAWYVNTGGITAFDLMLKELEKDIK